MNVDNDDPSSMSDGIKLTRDSKQDCVVVEELGVYKTLCFVGN